MDFGEAKVARVHKTKCQGDESCMKSRVHMRLAILFVPTRVEIHRIHGPSDTALRNVLPQ